MAFESSCREYSIQGDEGADRSEVGRTPLGTACAGADSRRSDQSPSLQSGFGPGAEYFQVVAACVLQTWCTLIQKSCGLVREAAITKAVQTNSEIITRA